MTTSRLRRPTSVSMTQTFSPRRASAAPTLAVVVVLPTPPVPDVTTMALAFTLWSLLQEPAPGSQAPPSASQGTGFAGLYHPGGAEPGAARPVSLASRRPAHAGVGGRRQAAEPPQPPRGRSGPRQAGVLQQQALGAGRLEDHRDLGAGPLAGEADDRARAELRVPHPLAAAERGERPGVA